MAGQGDVGLDWEDGLFSFFGQYNVVDYQHLLRWGPQMKSQDHNPANEDKAKVIPGIKTSPQFTHPILQLQQMVGNKAVTKMIQRHGTYAFANFDFRIRDNDVDEGWLRGVGQERR